jgi:deaminated glutathione amidase
MGNDYMSKIALLQMTSGIDPAANARTIVDAAREAAAEGAVMLCAPEMAALVDRDRSRATPHIVPEGESRFVAAMAEAAATAGIWLHAGSLPVLGSDGRWHNRSLLFDDGGAVRARYDKIHLFDVDLPNGESWRESAAYAPGATLTVVETPVGRLGLSICYDVRFGALFDALGAAGAELIAVPSAFTVPTGSAHWHLLLRARAVEQGCYIVAAAQSGEHADGRRTFGHSLVIDPWGTVLLDMGDAVGIGYAELDLAVVADVRARLPVIAHRQALPTVTSV